jgi:hypothetical protein
MQNGQDLYNFINFIADKNRRGYLSPDEVAQALSSGQVDLWNYYWGLPQTASGIKNGAPNPDYGSSQLTLDALSNFRRKILRTTSPTGVIYLYNTGHPYVSPSNPGYDITDLGHFIGMMKVDDLGNIYNIDQYLNSEIVDVLKSTLYPVDAQNQVFVFEGDAMQLYPRTQLPAQYKAEVQYIAMPQDVVFKYTTAGNSLTILPQGQIKQININYGGSGYTVAPTIAISAPVDADGNAVPNGVTATATCAITSGVITSVTIVNPGYGYKYPPTITLTGGTPTNAAVLQAIPALDPQFDPVYWVELIARSLPYIGVNLSAQEVQALAVQQLQST